MESITKHGKIQKQIVSACEAMGIEVRQEYNGKDWRADVFIPNSTRPIAFEIQLSPQSLTKTLERQAKYFRDNILGCWLFENPVPKLVKERPDLPVFYVEENEDCKLMVNLGERRKLDLQAFLENFISNNIQFRPIARTNFIQTVKLVFYEMRCWKCKELNHLYYVETPFYSSCNARIKQEEALWASNNIEYRPEIVALARKFVESTSALNLRLGQIKDRFSKTMNKSYMSFGCYNCDGIFGDFHVMEAKIDVMDNPNVIKHQGEIELKEAIELNIPHWCFPENRNFCGGH